MLQLVHSTSPTSNLENSVCDLRDVKNKMMQAQVIPIRPVPGKIRHSNLVFYFHNLVKFLVTVTEHFCCFFYRNYTFVGTIVNDERALINKIYSAEN